MFTKIIAGSLSRAPNILSRFLIISLFGGLTFLTACGASSSGDAPGDGAGNDIPITPGPIQALSCDAIRLDKDIAKPLEKIKISGITGADDETLYIRVKDTNGNEVPNAIFNAAGGDFEMLASIHPSGSPDGGMTTLLVTDGDVTCPPLSFTVLPLELPANDPVAEFDTAVTEFSNAYQRLAGLDGIDLNASLDQLPTEAIPLALIQTVMSSSAYRDSLDSMTDDQRRLFLGLLNELDLPVLMTGLTDALLQMPVLTTTETPVATTAIVKSSRLPITPLPANVAVKQAQQVFNPKFRNDASCEILTNNFSFDIQTPQDLISYMKLARDADALNQDLGRVIGPLNVVFAAIGTVSTPVGVAWGVATFGLSTVSAMASNILPYDLNQLSYEMSRSRIEEDWDVPQDGKITWFAARVSAKSKGMNFYRTGINAAATIASSVTGITLSKGFSQSLGNTIAAVDFAGQTSLSAKLDTLSESDPNTSCFSVRPSVYGPVNIPNAQLSDYLKAEVQGNAIQLSGGQLEEIIPEQVGNATLSVSTREDVFPADSINLDKIVQVVQKRLKWLPGTVKVDQPENEKMQTAKIRIDDARHAEPSDITVNPGAGVTLVGLPTGSNGLFTVQFIPPADRKAYPVDIIVTSTSKNLPPDTSPRTAKLLIISENKLEITPAGICLSAGQPQTFTATLSNPLPDAKLIWEYEGPGAITDSTGLTETYTAPPSVNYETITLRARLADDDQVNDEITFRLGPCVGPAAFYNVFNSIGFRCSGADEEYTDDTINESNSDLTIPLSQASIWRPGQRESIDKQFSNSLTCNNVTTSAASTNTSTVKLLPDGESFDIDIYLESQDECITDNNNEECSSANAGTYYNLRFETEIGRAENFLMDVSLACQISSNLLTGLGQSQVSIFVWRLDSQNNPIATNMTDIQKAFLGKVDLSCDESGTPLSYSKVIEFDAPALVGSKDRVGASVTIFMAETGMNEGEVNTSTMKGTVVFRQLVKQ